MTEPLYRKAHEHWSEERIKETARIREINDRHRKAGPAGPAQFFLSGDLSMEDAETHQAAILATVAFDKFTEENDPYGEHDYGKIFVCGKEAMFKIDYYDLDQEHGAEAPWIERETVRVISIFYAYDY